MTVARLLAWALLAASLALLTGCSSASKQKADQNGSVPVKTVEIPAVTTTIENRSSSMEPTVHCTPPNIGCEGAADDGLVVREPPGDVKRADIIVFRTPALANRECGAGGVFVKRLIGLPGDTWEERDGFVYINGKKLNEPYVKENRRDSQTLVLRDIPPTNTYTKIPNGYYLMMGDNRASSCDSRRWGLVPHRNLIGKVVQILRPATG